MSRKKSPKYCLLLICFFFLPSSPKYWLLLICFFFLPSSPKYCLLLICFLFQHKFLLLITCLYCTVYTYPTCTHEITSSNYLSILHCIYVPHLHSYLKAEMSDNPQKWLVKIDKESFASFALVLALSFLSACLKNEKGWVKKKNSKLDNPKSFDASLLWLKREKDWWPWPWPWLFSLHVSKGKGLSPKKN